jgi:hypothetical protein
MSLNSQEKTAEVENVEVEGVERVEGVETIREEHEKEESCESGVLLRVDTKFLQTRNLIAHRIIGNTSRKCTLLACAEAHRASRYLVLPVLIPSLLNISANLAGEPFHDVFCEQARGAEPDPFFHQLKQYVLSVFADAGHVPQFNHEFPTP